MSTRRRSSSNVLYHPVLLLLIASLVTLFSLPFAQAQNVLTQDTAKCFNSVVQADSDGDRRLDPAEYVAFLKLYGVPGIPGDSYQDLPLVLRSTFFSMSCICTMNGVAPESCCVGSDPYIPTDGAADSEIPTQAQETYLGRLCRLTDSAVDQILPTRSPVVTVAPSMSPSNSITDSPSRMPTGLAIPTGLPTITAPQKPTLFASQSPTSAPGTTTIQTKYNIVIRNGQLESIVPESYKEDLIKAMDLVVTEVVIIVENELGIAPSNRRRLAITVSLPTSIQEIAEQEWSNDGTSKLGACSTAMGNPEADSCQQVTASVDLFLNESESAVPAVFASTLEDEIAAGRLKEALLLYRPNSPVKVLNGSGQGSIPTPAPSNDTEIQGDAASLSTGAAIGIGATGAALLVVLYLTWKNKNSKPETNTRRQNDGKFVEATASEEMKVARKEVGSGLEWQAPRAPDEEVGISENPWVKKKRDDGSVVSDAGWSDAYSSSVGSRESEKEQDTLPTKTDIEGRENGSVSESANLGVLEAAIQSENWAAVGASAALLAASQYETDSQTNSKSSSKLDSYSSVQSSLNRRELDTEKTQELDNLIQSGDWEGVIQAAARFESGLSQGYQSPTVFEDSDSQSDSKNSNSDSRSGSFTIGSHFSSLRQSSVASASKATPQQAEFKREVQELVEKVVPEEADHVDDMIEQFKGRENELLETLRTMQERNIAKKAKRAEQERAKIEAKRMVAQARDKGEQPGQPAAAPMAPMPAPGASTAASPPSPATAPMAPIVPGAGGPIPAPATFTAAAQQEEENREDSAAAAAADWAIAQALSNLEKEQSSLEDQSHIIPDEDFDDEGSL